MKNLIDKKSFRIAFCGIISALCLALMLCTSLIPIGTYALPCFAGILITAIVVEYGIKWAIGVYVVVALLSLILAGDKEAAIYFVLIFGYYPIIKNFIEKKFNKKFLQYILKLIIFNVTTIIAFFVGTYIIMIPAEEYTINGFYLPWAFLLAGNIFFVIYDYAVTVFVGQYIRRLRGKLFK